MMNPRSILQSRVRMADIREAMRNEQADKKLVISGIHPSAILVDPKKTPIDIPTLYALIQDRVKDSKGAEYLTALAAFQTGNLEGVFHNAILRIPVDSRWTGPFMQLPGRECTVAVRAYPTLEDSLNDMEHYMTTNVLGVLVEMSFMNTPYEFGSRMGPVDQGEFGEPNDDPELGGIGLIQGDRHVIGMNFATLYHTLWA